MMVKQLVLAKYGAVAHLIMKSVIAAKQPPYAATRVTKHGVATKGRFVALK